MKAVLTTKLINSVEFLIECAGLVELDEVDYFLFSYKRKILERD